MKFIHGLNENYFQMLSRHKGSPQQVAPDVFDLAENQREFASPSGLEPVPFYFPSECVNHFKFGGIFITTE